MQAQEIAAGINFSVQAKEAELRMTLALMRSLKLWRLMRYQRLDHMTRKAVEYIKANYQHQISLHDVAESLQISDSHLSRLLSKSNRGFSDLLVIKVIHNNRRSFKRTLYAVVVDHIVKAAF